MVGVFLLDAKAIKEIFVNNANDLKVPHNNKSHMVKPCHIGAMINGLLSATVFHEEL